MRGSGSRRGCALRDASAEMPTTTSPRSTRYCPSGSRPVLRYSTVRLAIHPAPYGTSGGCGKRLKLIGQAPLAIAIVQEVLLCRRHSAAGDRVGDILMLLEIPGLIHFDARNHHPQNLDEIVIGEVDAQLPPCR